MFWDIHVASPAPPASHPFAFPLHRPLSQVLSDPEKRQVYDLEGVEGLERHEKGGGQAMNPFDMFFGGGQGGGRRKGPDAQVEIDVTLEELYNGGQRQARISRNIICPKCRGTGAKDGATTKCNACQGRGVRMVQQQMAPGFVVQMQETCQECGGKGTIFKTKCPNCQGRKVIMEEKTLTATIERGMPSSGEIRFERESEQQPGITPGESPPSLPLSPSDEYCAPRPADPLTPLAPPSLFPSHPRAGDVIFKLRQSNHPRFRRENDDLHHEEHITLREALLGFKKTIKHLDGRDVVLTHKGVTQPFEVRKVRPFVSQRGRGRRMRDDVAMKSHSFSPSPPLSLHLRRWRARACPSTTTPPSTALFTSSTSLTSPAPSRSSSRTQSRPSSRKGPFGPCLPPSLPVSSSLSGRRGERDERVSGVGGGWKDAPGGMRGAGDWHGVSVA
jgi:DnaJ-class molecular chaperone